MWKLSRSPPIGLAVVVDGMPVDPAEHERGVAEIEVGQPLDQRLVERVALEAGLEGAAEVGFGEVAKRHAASRLCSRHSYAWSM